jgi:hypothetical protein
VIRQYVLDTHGFSGAERHERTHSHTPFANVDAIAVNFRQVLSLDGDWNGDRITKIAPPFSQDESVSRLRMDGVERGLSKTKLALLLNADVTAALLPMAKLTAV